MTEQEKLECLIDGFMKLDQKGKNSIGELVQKLTHMHLHCARRLNVPATAGTGLRSVGQITVP